MTANPFFCKKEAIIKDFGINLLDLIFFNQISKFLGDLTRIQFDWTGGFQKVEGLLQQVPSFHIGISRLHATLKETMDKTRTEALRSLAFNSQFLGQLVSDGKSQTLDILDQLIGIVLDNLQRFFLVKVLDLKGQLIWDAVISQFG